MASAQWLQLPFDLVSPAEAISAGIILPIAYIALVGVRFHASKLQKASLGIDDWLIAIGVVFITGMIQFAFQFLMCFAYGFVKASIIFFCRRIFVGHKGSTFDWASKGCLFLVIFWSVGFLMGLTFGCGKEVELQWAPLQVLEEAGCDGVTPEEAMVISDFILDLLIIILPLPATWSLSMSTKGKLALTGIFLIGLTSVAASAARMAIYLTVLYQGYSAGYDINRTATTMLWWSMLEVSLASMVACLPTLSFLGKTAGMQKLFYRLGSVPSFTSSWKPWGISSKSKENSGLSQESLYGESIPYT
ncbi:hypothetical protein F4811DRAFT_551464 [Daldinia bambusicola]|nr:hypothetical protein F4811DRAFT_551464 [Daldinia bambusicola]